MTARYVVATVQGTTYQIPALWMVGAMRGMSMAQAILHWHEQSQMAQAFQAQRRAA